MRGNVFDPAEADAVVGGDVDHRSHLLLGGLNPAVKRANPDFPREAPTPAVRGFRAGLPSGGRRLAMVLAAPLYTLSFLGASHGSCADSALAVPDIVQFRALQGGGSKFSVTRHPRSC